jgi:outer membrane protein assembly factor BamB
LTGICLCFALAGTVLAAHGEKIAETVLPGEARPLVGRLASTDRLIAASNWNAALDELQRLLGEPESSLVPLDPLRPRHLVNLRRLVHFRLAALPEKALRLYRLRVDSKARKWLTEGRARRDPVPLRRLVDEAFCSSHTDEALELLGDLCFEKGYFDEARRCWRTLASLTGEDSPSIGLDPLRIPSSKIDVSRVRAKQLLAHLFLGDLVEAAVGIDCFHRHHSEARGHLSGRSGRYSDILQEIFLRSLKEGDLCNEPDWASFGGNDSRNLIPQRALDRCVWTGGPAWKVRLDGRDDEEETHPTRVVAPSVAARQLAFFPVIVDDLIIVSDSSTVKGYELTTGRREFLYDLAGDSARDGLKSLSRNLPVPLNLRYTLTATDDAVFVRLGRQKIGPRENAGPDSYLVRLDLRPEVGKRGLRRWLIKAPTKPDEIGAFEGSPVVYDGLVYIAHSRFKGSHTQTAVVCYRAEDGAELWRHEMCVTAEFQSDSGPRYRHHLLTLAGPNLVYCSHSGAVVAVELRTGRPAWAIRYPSVAGTLSPESTTARDLGACVYHSDRVFVAPSDNNTLYCLDAETGGTIWEREGLDTAHLIGVSHGLLVLTTRDGIRAVDARTGRDREGWVQPDTGRLPSYGRTLIAGGWVLWSSQDAEFPVRALNLQDGCQEREGIVFNLEELKRIPPGNMAFAHGCLVSAGTEEMFVYAPRQIAPTPRSAPK